MLRFWGELLRLKIDRRAVTAVEYALIVALIAVAIMGAVGGFGRNAAATFNKISSEL
jgi:pilus assembly protein Flp/PilA